MRGVIQVCRWSLWLSFTAWLFLAGLWGHAWRLGILKYCCMQTFTPSMHAFMNFVYHPLSCALFNLMLVFSFASVAMMVFCIKHRHQTKEKLQRLFESRKSKVLALIAAFVLIDCSYSFSAPYSPIHLPLALLTGALVVVFSIAWE